MGPETKSQIIIDEIVSNDDRLEIEKPSLSVFRELCSNLNGNKEIIREFIQTYPESHLKLNELGEICGVRKQRISVILHELKDEGLEYETFRENRIKKNLIKSKERENRLAEKSIFRRKVINLLNEGNSGPRVENMLDEEGICKKHVRSVVTYVRLKGEVPRVRNIRRSREEIEVMDQKVKKLYDLGLPASAICEITNLDKYLLAGSLTRLHKNGEITRRRERSKNKN